jgi:hypothetical protein
MRSFVAEFLILRCEAQPSLELRTAVLKHDRNLNIAVQTGFKATLRQGLQQRRTGLLPA